MFRPAFAFLLFVQLAATFCSRSILAQRPAGASDLYVRFAPLATRIQISDSTSGVRSSHGSGFFVSAAGHVVTNYHVVSDLVNRPGRYRAELINADGTTSPARILAIDVVNDLAILATDRAQQKYFNLAPVRIRHGERLFSLGNPRDLGMSIVEGTYNGLLQHTIHPRVHVTASLNPGMSGGPTIDGAGNVVGINVASEGEQVSYLVPVDYAASLLKSVVRGDTLNVAPTLVVVSQQLQRHQRTMLENLFDSSAARVQFGPFRVAGKPAPAFRCWSSEDRSANTPLHRMHQECGTEDDVFLDDDVLTGTVSMHHELITNRALNRMQFFAAYSRLFAADDAPWGAEEFVTSWNCTTRNVRNGSTSMRAVLCLRRYRTLHQLYDASLKVAVLGTSDVGLISTLNLSGVMFESVPRIADRFIRQISWR